MDIITPILILVGIGIFTGILLSVASIVFYVKTDDRVSQIEAVLPGANCGGCGLSGCTAYAEALVDDPDIKTNLCTPGGSEVSLEISKILGKEFKSVDKKVAVVACNGNCEATKKIYEYKGAQTCSAAAGFYRGNSSCDFGCLGFGDCKNICAFNAICMIDGIAVINEYLCTGCGTCVKKCPKAIIQLRKITNKVNVLCSSQDSPKTTMKNCKNGCIGCKKCEKVCEFNAIKVTNSNASIDYEKCTNCGKCIEFCPIKCIK